MRLVCNCGLSLLAIALLFAGCSNNDGGGDGDLTTTRTLTLTPEGGTVTLDGARIVFPAGAVTEPQEITAAVVATPPVALGGDRVLAGSVLSLIPHDFALRAAATVTLRRTSSAPGTLRFVRLANEAASTWTDEGPATASGDDLQFSLTRFSFETVAIENTSGCTPDCATRVCGIDPVCGLPCGACPVPQQCTAAGTCVAGQPNCIQDCTGRQCGTDPVCGQSCGVCDFGQSCNASGVCEGASCIPRDCTGVACGSNGCSGSCGSPCGAATVCSSGACVDTWTSAGAPCSNQPEGSVMPMTGGCAERPQRSAFAPLGGTSLARAWSWRPPSASNFGSRSLYSPVVDDQGTIYVSNLNAVWAIADLGTSARTIWQLTTTDLGDASDGIISAPVVVGSTVIVVTKAGRVHARNTNNGSQKWTASVGGALTYVPVYPAVLADRVILYGNNKMWSFALANGNVLMERDYSGDYVLDLSLRGNLLVGGAISSNYIMGYDYSSTSNEPVWYAYANSLSRDVPVTFLTNGHVFATIFEAGRERVLDITPPAPGDQPAVKKVDAPDMFVQTRVALSADDVALVTNGSRTSNPAHFQAHCLFDMKLATPTCVSVTPNDRTTVYARPLALGDGTFVMVDINGKVSLIGTNGAISRSLELAPAVDPDVFSQDAYYGSPIVGANGTIFVAFGGGGGELHAVRSVE